MLDSARALMVLINHVKEEGHFGKVQILYLTLSNF